MKLFETLESHESLRPIDLEWARAVAALETGPAEILAHTALLLSAQRRQGHPCLLLDTWAGQPFPDDTDHVLPDATTWRNALCTATTVGDGQAPVPIVFDGERLYLYRYWQAEQTLAHHLAHRLSALAEEEISEATQVLFESLFPPENLPPPGTENRQITEGKGRGGGDLFAPAPAAEVRPPPNPLLRTGGRDSVPDGQALAAAAALRYPLCVISGGPGTGKTTTVTKLLALLLTQHPGCRIALAAPTGKAAQRLTASMTAQREALPETVRAQIPTEVLTLHRLLGYQPSADRFRHDARYPLDVDVLVVDECSMVDLPLFHALLDALPPQARLVLVGDKDQLDSVEVGAVFGELCALGDALPQVVTLTKTYRFGPDSGIGHLATALRGGDAEKALSVLHDERFADVTLRPHPASAETAMAEVLPQARRLVAEQSPEAALGMLATVQLLAATWWGPWGVHALNRAVESVLRAERRIGRGAWYAGRPVLVTANDYSVGLFNGDLGVMGWAGSDLVVYFPDGKGGVRAVAPARLPPHETAWAMTVHKSQGSEFNRVVLVLPEADTPLVNRALLYTAATRAKEKLTVIGPEAVLRQGTVREARRPSGLGAALRETATVHPPDIR